MGTNGVQAADRAFMALACALACWLLASLYLVNIEFDDGYATIANSQYFLGLSDYYYWQRGPLMAWLLLPAEWMANLLDLHPLDVRPHHLVTVLLHLGYVAGVWMILRRHHGAGLPALLAFTAAVPTVLFFSYAPFVSHDLMPGLALLWMLLRARTYLLAPSGRDWWLLATVGAAVVLVKQTYAAFWVVVLLAQMTWLPRATEGRRDWLRRWAALCGAALASACVAWLGYAWVLASSFPDSFWLIRPWLQAQTITRLYEDGAGSISAMFYQRVYLRNLHAYGVLAMALIAPGLWFSLAAKDTLLRSVAVAWILMFLLVLCIPFKEVRYLGFLAPLTAMLIAPGIEALLRLRWNYVWGLVLILAVDLYGVGTEAWRIADPYYRSVVPAFLGALPSASPPPEPVVFVGRLSFVDHVHPAFYGDRYHRITHLVDTQVRDLFRYPRDRLRQVGDPRSLDADDFEPGQILIFSNDFAARVPPIRRDNATTLQPDFAQLLAVAERVELRLEGGQYRLSAASTLPTMLLPKAGSGSNPLTAFDRFDAKAVAAMLGIANPPEQLTVLAFRIRALCNLQGCRQF